MKISFVSDIGQVRSTNQDYTKFFYNQEEFPLVLLADGMGGHKAGDIASHLVVETLGLKWQETDFSIPGTAVEWLVKEIKGLNQFICEKGLDEKFLGMGTTLEALAIFKGTCVIAHVGDSRSYLIHEGEILQITQDHSLVNDLFSAGEITEEEVEDHPQKNIITRSIGMPEDVDVDILEKVFLPGDLLLLCSDGLTNMVSDEEILEILTNSKGMERALTELIDLANEKGGKDNITASLIFLEAEDVK
jgi:protein phosphatase